MAIAEVLEECLDVPAEVIDAAGILVEVARWRVGLYRALEAFSAGEREAWRRIDTLPRARTASSSRTSSRNGWTS